MREKEYNAKFDFLCEKRLRQTDADLHQRFRTSVFAMDLLLTSYKTIFPFFTDHTFEHSEQVINYCNIIAGDDIINLLNADEIYILLMGASLHDVGMGISEMDFNGMKDSAAGLPEYIAEHPYYPLGEYTRLFHQELSAQFIKKYSGLFEIPDEEYIYCISQVARGHRKADLLDKEQYPMDFTLKNGQKVNLAYLTALVKLADELDITADRNIFFDYKNVDKMWSGRQLMCYKCHDAIKRLDVRSESLVLCYDTEEPDIEQEILNMYGKVERTFVEYCSVVEKRTMFKNRLKSILFERKEK